MSNWTHPGKIYSVRDHHGQYKDAFDCERIRHIIKMVLDDETPNGFYSDADCILWGAIHDELKSYFKEKKDYYSDVYFLRIERKDDTVSYYEDPWIPEGIYTQDPTDTLADLAGDIIAGDVRYVGVDKVTVEEAMNNYKGNRSFVW